MWLVRGARRLANAPASASPSSVLRQLSTASVTTSDEKSGSGSRRVRTAAITVTAAAAARIQELISRRNPPALGVRIGLRTRGCNGMAYTLDYADTAEKFDERVEIDGAEVFIAPNALMHVIGTKMDFVDDELRSEFVFDNPNAKGQCGCGESFNV